MSFDKPRTRQVEQQTLTRVHGLIGELDLHIHQFDIAHPIHAKYVDARLKMLNELLAELRGLNREQSQPMD